MKVTQQDTISVSIVVLRAFAITTDSLDLPNGIELMSYTFQLVASNVPPGQNVVWSIDSGSLPPGLSLVPATGIISGIAEVGSVGRYPFVIRATTVPMG